MPHCQSIVDELRLKGYRITPQREMIVEALAHGIGHVTAEKIFAIVQARSKAINLATVYRTLDLLVAAGLACRVDLLDGRVVYTTSRHDPHIHLVCRQCGAIISADQALLLPLGEQLLAQHSFNADLKHVSFVGLCAACQAQSLPHP